MHYRRDIDGLRAIAVVPVVLYHAGSAWFPGGYVGVDVFFVISGFLITSMILHDLQNDRFSIVTFYERRIRRIFPALFLVLAFCAVAATLLYLPDQLKSFARSLMATVFFVSNYHFYLDTGYFAAPPDTKPLLHTWSLAVEEQFYIVFPAFMVLAFRWGGRRWIAIVAALFVLSLALSIGMTQSNRAGAFYLAHSRAWELLLGALLASGVLPAMKIQWRREAVALLGVVLIVVATLTFKEGMRTFPGPAALVPCLGAALVLYAGEKGSTVVARALSLGPVVFIGLISYSLYLWHWPLLVFARYWTIQELSIAQTAAIVAASFVLAALSWRFVEQPFRRRPVAVPRKPLFAAAATAAAIAFTFGVLTDRSGGWPNRLSAEARAILETGTRGGSRERDGCVSTPSGETCAPVGYAVWGDSHGGTMGPAVVDAARRHGQAVRFFLRAACPQAQGFESRYANYECRDWAESTLRELKSSPSIHTVVLIARHAVYIADFAGQESGSRKRLRRAVSAVGGNLDPEAHRRLYEKKLSETVEALLGAGKTVAIVYPVPDADFDVPSAAGRHLMTEGRLDGLKGTTEAVFQQRQHDVFAILDRLGERDKLVRIYPHRRLCDAERCKLYADSKLLYIDDNHLSRSGAHYISPEFDSIFEQSVALSPATSTR